MFNDIKIGDSIVIRDTDYRGNRCEPTLEPVSKVGRLYFYVGIGYNQRAYVKETGLEKTSANYKSKAYLDMHHYNDEMEKMQLSDYVADKYRSYGRPSLTLDQLRRIKAILDEPK